MLAQGLLNKTTMQLVTVLWGMQAYYAHNALLDILEIAHLSVLNVLHNGRTF